MIYNTAVMSARTEPDNSLDDFPTPPWATRALCEYVIRGYRNDSCLEPAAGRGFMSEALKEYFKNVNSIDIFDYGYCCAVDGGFLENTYTENTIDWVITNPPFNLAEEFIKEGLRIASTGVAMLTRTVFLESKGRYERLFSINPPTYVAQFVERVPMVKGRIDKKASTATGYAWLVWIKNDIIQIDPPCSTLLWIPPCRKKLEKDDDYIIPNERKVK